VACAAALAVLDMLEEGSRACVAAARGLGEKLRARLEAWKERYPAVGDVRGMGPMLGVELVKSRDTKEPDKEGAQRLARHCYENGLVILTAGTYGNVIRLAMPLVIEDSVLDEGLAVMEEGLKALGGGA
jgi:4-aminobutyrate aminotransferase/(S)-3-amino-2-methylpropionate transaminase